MSLVSAIFASRLSPIPFARSLRAHVILDIANVATCTELHSFDEVITMLLMQREKVRDAAITGRGMIGFLLTGLPDNSRVI